MTENRKLAAILAADVVGYSRLMQEDEAGTLAALKRRRKEILEPTVARHRGRIIKVMGDGVLIEFASAVAAVQCAVELQQAMSAANYSNDANDANDQNRKTILLRIGVNLGDVIVEGSDLYGDGVNVAARLEALAEPGTICISAKVRDEVQGKIDVKLEDTGKVALKNMERPVHVFRVNAGPTMHQVKKEHGLGTGAKPSIAVLPFTNMSGDPTQEYFSDGITEDIITELSRFRSLFVIARNSSFVFKNMSIKVQDVASELGVAYIVEGSVRRADDRVRITAQLVDAGTGNHLWAERYDRNMRDIFALQDEVARSIASTVSGRVDVAGRDRAVHLSDAALRAYDVLLRAKASILNYSRIDNEQAHACADRAMTLDPTSARAHALAAWCHFQNYYAWWTADRQNALATAYELSKRSVALDETDSFTHCMLGIIHLFRREFEEARSEIEKALELNPNDNDARSVYGQFLTAVGQADAAIEQIDLAKRLNPFDTRWVPWGMGMACFTAHRYDEAIAALRQVRDPINEVRGWLAASYAQAGCLPEAKAKLDEFLRVAETDMAVFPGRTLKDWEPYWHGALEYQNQEDFDHLFGALCKAGMPE